MEHFLAVSKAFALEGAFHFVEMVIEGIRRHGLKILRPEILPFKSMPLFEVFAGTAAAVATVFDVQTAWYFFDAALALHFAAYLWVETGIDLVATLLLTFIAPQMSRYAMSACLFMVTMILLQPRCTIPRSLWQHSVFIVLLSASRLLYAIEQRLAAIICVGVAVEVAVAALSRRIYGNMLRAPSRIGFWLESIMWTFVGVRFVDAAAWLQIKPAVSSDLPENTRRALFFCNSQLIRGVRFYTGRVVDDDTVAISIGEWDEIAFAPNAYGFILALLASLRLPMSLRATIDQTKTHISNTRLVFLFFELPESLWTRLTESHEATNDACMQKGGLLLLPSRLTLRRITEVMLSWLFVKQQDVQNMLTPC